MSLRAIKTALLSILGEGGLAVREAFPAGEMTRLTEPVTALSLQLAQAEKQNQGLRKLEKARQNHVLLQEQAKEIQKLEKRLHRAERAEQLSSDETLFRREAAGLVRAEKELEHRMQAEARFKGERLQAAAAFEEAQKQMPQGDELARQADRLAEALPRFKAARTALSRTESGTGQPAFSSAMICLNMK